MRNIFASRWTKVSAAAAIAGQVRHSPIHAARAARPTSPTAPDTSLAGKAPARDCCALIAQAIKAKG